ncbi:acyl-CoA thioesterase II [Streptomyces sp. YC504]|uniref:Acyl-CoA thioesterase 2 n=1 Tax=Streptomyces mesophilus TaxID=1775132 RepID=A0A6G4XBB9_9ACTN|nr:acyl-CoA thioesterase II [Streptomyces mesophilus]NGO74150.1 acyl-CoA thioesterase II [Streptomyces mesophilus]
MHPRTLVDSSDALTPVSPAGKKNLIDFLSLERVERDLFRGWCHDGARLRAFGGQVAAQALTAAGHTVDEAFAVHSLHGYFLRAGDTRRPIVYQVERLRDGRGYVSRRVTAVQLGEPIFTLSASFKVPEETAPGEARHVTMPPAVPPEELPDAFAPVLGSGDLPEDHDVREFHRALSVRFVPPPRPAPEGGTEQWLWVKAAHPLPDDPMLHACGLAYASDLLLAPSAALHREPPWIQRKRPDTVFLTSLDHAIWFHRPFRADEWLLVVQRSPTAGDGRGLAHGDFWTRDGRLVASVVQETVLRTVRPRSV